MKTELINKPSSVQLQELDEKVNAYILETQEILAAQEEDDGYPMYEGAELKIAILETAPASSELLQPYRVISVDGVNGVNDISAQLEEFGFSCINKVDSFPTQGYNCIFVLK